MHYLVNLMTVVIQFALCIRIHLEDGFIVEVEFCWNETTAFLLAIAWRYK